MMIALPARADQRYAVSGSDRYRIGSSDLQTNISYSGTQQLTIRSIGQQKQFRADAKYVRIDDSGRVPTHAAFVQILTPQGELQDRTDGDPDYLTVLNQPFAIELDQQTLHDLLRLKIFVAPRSMLCCRSTASAKLWPKPFWRGSPNRIIRNCSTNSRASAYGHNLPPATEDRSTVKASP